MNTYTKRALLLLFSVSLLMNAQPSFACSTFTLKKDDHFVYGRNLDWHVDSGMICVNQRNMAKKAFVAPTKSSSKGNAMEWTSKYGSVTFNGLGREFPYGGMNEVGLVVDIMWLHETQYPQVDSRKEIGALQWGQYLLDTCSTVDEVVASLEKTRISQNEIAKVHFLIADRENNTLVVDFVDGEAKTYTGETLPQPVLTNITYQKTIQYAKYFDGLGADKPTGRSLDSMDRFVRISDAVRQSASKDIDPVKYSFRILHSVNAGYELNQHSTVLSAVYDIANLSINFRTNSNRNVRTIHLGELNFSNERPMRVWNVLNDLDGDITEKSINYSNELNHQTVAKHLTNPGVVRRVGDLRVLIDYFSGYPEKGIRPVRLGSEH